MNSAPVATVTAVTFIGVVAAVLCELAQVKDEAKTVDCTGKETGTQEVTVNVPNTTLTLKCRAGDSPKVKPAFDSDHFKVCTQENCTTEQLLSTYIDGATGTKVSEVEATVKITHLPLTEKIFYVRCGDTGAKVCYLLVKVASSKPAAGGSGQQGVPGGVPGSAGGGTTGVPLSCATPGKAITIKIPEKGSTAQFTCGQLTLYPVAADKVFAENCKKEEDLKNIVRSAEADVYTLTADKKPPKKKWCYLCAKSSVNAKDPGQASDYCLVHVESSSRTRSSSAVALAAMLPCVLAMMRIT